MINKSVLLLVTSFTFVLAGCQTFQQKQEEAGAIKLTGAQ